MKTIKEWAMDDRPREKLVNKGAKFLSDAELLAIVLGSGTQKQSALDLAKEIMNGSTNSYKRLSECSINQLKSFKGVGEAKAVGVLATFEIARRRMMEKETKTIQVKSAKDAYEILRPSFYGLKHEEFHVIYLNRANSVLLTESISKGGLSGTIADGKIIFRNALSHSASALILAHNHPSGQLKPSLADKNLTKTMSEFGKLIDLQILDHLIVTNDNYFSFADEGLM